MNANDDRFARALHLASKSTALGEAFSPPIVNTASIGSRPIQAARISTRGGATRPGPRSKKRFPFSKTPRRLRFLRGWPPSPRCFCDL